MTEVWNDLPGYPGYEVSDLGRVRSRMWGQYRIRKLAVDAFGHRRVGLRLNGKYKLCLVHRLVAEVFIPNPDNKPLVLHRVSVRDGGSDCADNLYWGTQSENILDSVRDGSHPSISANHRGEGHSRSKLTDADVQEIRRLCGLGMRQRDIAEQFGITQPTVSSINSRRAWGHL